MARTITSTIDAGKPFAYSSVERVDGRIVVCSRSYKVTRRDGPLELESQEFSKPSDRAHKLMTEVLAIKGVTDAKLIMSGLQVTYDAARANKVLDKAEKLVKLAAAKIRPGDYI